MCTYPRYGMFREEGVAYWHFSDEGLVASAKLIYDKRILARMTKQLEREQKFLQSAINRTKEFIKQVRDQIDKADHTPMDHIVEVRTTSTGHRAVFTVVTLIKKPRVDDPANGYSECEQAFGWKESAAAESYAQEMAREFGAEIIRINQECRRYAHLITTRPSYNAKEAP